MFGTQPPIATTNYRTQSLFNKKKNVLTIRDFQKASAQQRLRQFSVKLVSVTSQQMCQIVVVIP